MQTLHYANTIKRYLNRVGRQCSVVHGDQCIAVANVVIQPVWRKAKNRFDPVPIPIGDMRNDYSIYIGPAVPDITLFGDDHILISDGVKYFFLKKERVIVGNTVQYCTGILKRLYEEDDYAD